MNALSRPTNSVYQTTLFLIGGWYTGRMTAAEAELVEPDFVQLRWPDAEGPDEKVSHYTGCPATQGRTLLQKSVGPCYVADVSKRNSQLARECI
jgi:hypothetical protein